jgi:hypothetical protein
MQIGNLREESGQAGPGQAGPEADPEMRRAKAATSDWGRGAGWRPLARSPVRRRSTCVCACVCVRVCVCARVRAWACVHASCVRACLFSMRVCVSSVCVCVCVLVRAWACVCDDAGQGGGWGKEACK